MFMDLGTNTPLNWIMRRNLFLLFSTNQVYKVLINGIDRQKWHDIHAVCTNISGGSRISQTGSANLSFSRIFAENCMKIKEIGPGERQGRSPWIHQCKLLTTISKISVQINCQVASYQSTKTYKLT